jgi:hypothetical protein
LFGGARERKRFGDGAEVAKLVEFHGAVSRRKPRPQRPLGGSVVRFLNFGYRLYLSIVSELGIGTMDAERLPFEAADIDFGAGEVWRSATKPALRRK